MGGGDLNLKKSWHPSTMRNIEKVWKAEQRENEERKRIAELQREIIAERSREDMQRFAENSGVVEKKDNTKLDWMYKGPSGIVDREEYLLGRAIDKTFEQLQQSEQPGKAVSSRKNAVERGDECLPNSIRFAADQQVDLARKMQEDPLLAIKKKEVETRQQLLSNPVKLKQLKQLFEMQSKQKKQKKEKKAKKDKKKRKKKKSSKSKDSDSDTSQGGDVSKLDAILAKKLSSLKNAGLLKSLNEHIDDLEESPKKAHDKREKERQDSDSEEHRKNTKYFSSKHQWSESKSIDQGNRSRDKIKRERSESREKNADRRKMSRTETYSERPKEELGKGRRNESYDRKDNGSQKSRNNYDSEDDSKHRKPKYDDRREQFHKTARNGRSNSKSPDRGQRHYQNRTYRNKSKSKSPDRGSRHYKGRVDRNRRSNSKSPDRGQRHYQDRIHRNRSKSKSPDRGQRHYQDRIHRNISKSKSPDRGSRRYKDRVDRNKRSNSKSPDRGQRQYQNRVDRNKEEIRKISASDDKIKKSRTRRESDTSDRSERSNKKEKWNEKLKKPTKEDESSDSSDSDSSSDSSSEDDSDRKHEMYVKRERRSDSGERRPQLPKFGLMLPDGSRPVPKAAPVKEEKRSERAPEKSKWTKPERKKLDDKDIEARRREMMENSSWREKERQREMKRHKVEQEEERQEENRQRAKFDENFGRKQLAHAVSQSTVEERIKSNVKNIQRSKNAMDRNFARR